MKIGDEVWFLRNDGEKEKVLIIGQSAGNPVIKFSDGNRRVTYIQHLSPIKGESEDH